MLPDYLRVLAEPGRCQKFLDPVYASVPVFPRIVLLIVLLSAVAKYFFCSPNTCQGEWGMTRQYLAIPYAF